jgi:nucleoside-diphosphate-sugar epimerase
MSKRILLTGATGFVGSHLLQSLIYNQHIVLVLLRPQSNTWRINALGNSFAREIVTEHTDFDAIIQANAIDTIIHTATEYGKNQPASAVINSNVLFPLRLMEAGLRNGLKRWINTDTFSSKPDQSSSYLQLYNVTKKMLLQQLQEASHQLRVDNLRLEHPFGENDAANKFVGQLIEALLQQQPRIAFTAGEQKRDFIYVQDVVQAYIKVLEQDDDVKGLQEFQVGTGQSIALKDFIKEAAVIANSTSQLGFGDLPLRTVEIMDSKADTRALNQIGWYPQFDLHTALQRTIASFESTS